MDIASINPHISNMTTTQNTAAQNADASTEPTSAYARYAAKAAPVVEEITFGIEIETKGNGNRRCAEIVAAAIGGTVEQGYGMGRIHVRAADGRKWTCMNDGSLHGTSCEIVSPILKGSDDIETVQNIARALRRPSTVGLTHARGCTIDSECGIHVHIGVQGWEPKAINRLVKLVYSQEDLLIAMLECQTRTEGRWCKRVSEDFMRNLPRRPNTMNSIGRAWYGSSGVMRSARHSHYHDSRYRGLNLHNLWFGPHGESRGTVEFRYFSPTLHAGRIRTYIELCLSLGARAKLSKGGVARKRTRAVWTKYDARVFMIRLGMMGDRYSNPRKFLMAHLAGNSRSGNTGATRGGVTRAARNSRDNVTHTH